MSKLEAETGLLSICLNNDKNMPYIMNSVKVDDFDSPSNKIIFEAISKLYNSNMDVDIVTVSDQLKKDDKLDKIGGRDTINDIALEFISSFHYKSYIKTIVDESKRRQLKALADNLINSVDTTEDINKLIVDCNAKATKILTRSDQEVVPSIAEGALEVYNDLEKIYESGEPLGLQTDFTKLNDMLGGFQGGKLYILAARPSMGKSMLALNISEVVARDKNVLFFSLEMDRKELAKRVMLKLARTNSHLLQKGLVDDEIITRMTESLSTLADLNLFVDDKCPLTPSKVELSILNTINHKGSCDMVVIDYLQLMDADGKPKDRQAAISEISRSLKQLARKYNVPIIALSQLSRSLELRENKRPMLCDLRESGAIEQDADVVMFIYRDEVYNPNDFANKGLAEVIIAKQRDGDKGTIKFSFNGNQSEFKEMKGVIS